MTLTNSELPNVPAEQLINAAVDRSLAFIPMPQTAEEVNRIIEQLPDNQKQLVRDGYHSFKELYEHRCQLWITALRVFDKLCAVRYQDGAMHSGVWRTRAHSDGSVWVGWFLLGYGTAAGQQMTYHLPIELWDECWFAATLDKAPLFDDHSSADVLKRLKQL